MSEDTWRPGEHEAMLDASRRQALGMTCDHDPESMEYPMFGGNPFCLECSSAELSFLKTTREGAIAVWRALDEAGIRARLEPSKRPDRWQVYHASADHRKAPKVLDALRAAPQGMSFTEYRERYGGESATPEGET